MRTNYRRLTYLDDIVIHHVLNTNFSTFRGTMDIYRVSIFIRAD